ncbi:hypothetical protein [Chitinilyticum piscinae]|uniref:Uncharacterized protein n=1 Tax=Chitinilyticum piscinae TaxID=2866724 RepID=A0A8J7K0Q9_9NEIS|nr:hypothetical protein [Chitinilyticum piscinae]MBE9608261.1 hypothetical protein [Chitinilyticum piscinae]
MATAYVLDARLIRESDGTQALYAIAAAERDGNTASGSILIGRFLNTSKGWQAVQRTESSLGFGNPPAAESIRWLDLGTGHAGWLISAWTFRQGYSSERWLIGGYKDGQIAELGSIDGSVSNAGACKPNARCQESDTKLEVLASANQPLQLRTTTTGTISDAQGKLVQLAKPLVRVWGLDPASGRYKARNTSTEEVVASSNLGSDPRLLIGKTLPGGIDDSGKYPLLKSAGWIETPPGSKAAKSFTQFDVRGGGREEYDNAARHWQLILASRPEQQWLLVVDKRSFVVADAQPVGPYDMNKLTVEHSYQGEAGGQSCITGTQKLPQLIGDSKQLVQIGFLPSPKFKQGKSDDMSGWHKHRWDAKQTQGRLWELDARSGKLRTLPAESFRCEGGWSD